jgi:hypothetical protein
MYKLADAQFNPQEGAGKLFTGTWRVGSPPVEQTEKGGKYE